jgi:outer membrane protein OmpA-like peptidoglycan-associated protein
MYDGNGGVVKKTAITMLFLALSAVTGLEAETFTHKFTTGEKYRIVATVEEKVLYNDELIGQASTLFKIASEVTGVVAGTGNISALYQISERGESSEGSYQLKNESRSVFTVDKQGRYRLGPAYFQPSVFDVPLFPETNVEPETAWTAPGTEIFDLREPFGIRAPVRIPISVKYTFLGDENRDGRRLARFSLEYEYRHDLTGVKGFPDMAIPIKISGAHSIKLVWDIDSGKTNSYEEDFYVLYNLSNKDWMEFMGTSKGEMTVSRPLDKKETVDKINEDIEKEKIEGVKAESVEDGVKITLENIQFEPDSDAITAGEARKIETIASILKKYPGRDIRVTGHTAAVGTPASCLELSLKRARAVADALLENKARTPEEMTVEGKGLTKPIAPNNTENGRIKNRRVEITILEN